MKKWFSLFLFSSLLISSCDNDPFDFQKKHIEKSWYLEEFTEGTPYIYFILQKQGLGYENIFEGTIQRIYISDHILYADIFKNYRGDIDGIYTLDMRTGNIAGPLTDLPDEVKFQDIESYYKSL